MPQVALAALERLSGPLPIALLLTLLGLWPECLACVGDVVLHSVTRGVAYCTSQASRGLGSSGRSPRVALAHAAGVCSSRSASFVA